jgi:outer membrane protein OmpA-like peptidoglycan-associated protein
MTDVRITSRPSSLRRTLLQACVVSLLPVGTALAQTGPLVRITTPDTDILTFQHAQDDVLTTADAGTVMTVIHTQGDKYRHLESNWYWVLLPRDAWGTQRSGWVRGRDVELLPPSEPPKMAPAAPQVQRIRQPEDALEPTPAVPPVAQPAAAAAPAEPVVREMLLNFEFGKSDLTDEARGKLAGAVAMLRDAQSVTIALEGHADAIGTEPFNEKLGLARAETVKQHLAEQHQIPVDKISVVSFGEVQPEATNDTPEGRARNRRVVVKVGM